MVAEHNGEGVLKDNQQALRWFRLVADQEEAFTYSKLPLWSGSCLVNATQERPYARIQQPCAAKKFEEDVGTD